LCDEAAGGDEAIYWYVTEASTLNADVGVSAVEKRAAGAREHS
jgi:hypothetical protein